MAEVISENYLSLSELPKDFQWRECPRPGCKNGVICNKGCSKPLCPDCDGIGWICMGPKVEIP